MRGENMIEYFLGLIVFAFVGAVIISLVPAGNSKRYVRLICGLCSVCCIAFPIFELVDINGGYIDEIISAFTTDDAIKNADEIYNNSLNSATVENAEDSLKNDIIKGTSIKYNDVDVKIKLEKNGDEFYIDGIIVYLYGSGYTADPKRIYDVCRDRLGRECTIIYK